MKKPLFLLCFIFMLLLAACGGGTDGGEVTAIDESSAAPYVLKAAPEDKNPASFAWDFVETPDGYYYVFQKSSGNGSFDMLYFCPRGGDSFRPLCGKPNCKHEDRDCNAFIGCSIFGYYNGALYTVDWNRMEVIKMNLDGTDHQAVATIDDAKYRDCSYQGIFHHGYLFLYFRASYDQPLEERTDHLVVLNLADYSQKEIATEFLRTADLPAPLVYYKDKLYMLGSGDKAQTYDVYKNKLIEIDADTGEARVVLPQSIGALYVTDSTLYYFQPDYEATGRGAGDGSIVPGFRELDVETGTIKDCGLPIEDAMWARYDEDYIYVLGYYRNNDQNQTLYILSRNYELLDQFELEDSLQIHTITSDRIYIYKSGNFEAPISCYLDKSQIGSHNLKLIPIETIG